MGVCSVRLVICRVAAALHAQDVPVPRVRRDRKGNLAQLDQRGRKGNLAQLDQRGRKGNMAQLDQRGRKGNLAQPGRRVRRESLARLAPPEIKGVWGAEAPQGLLDPKDQWDCQAPLVPED